MRNSRLRISLIVSILLTFMLACVVPGLSPPSLPAPTADTVLLATMVAETVSAAFTQTANALPVSPTLTPEPPVVETPTAETSAAGSLLTKQADGSTVFSDQLAGYEVIAPPGWLAVRLNEQEYLDAWTLAETADPAIQRSLTNIQNQNPRQFRLFVLDTQEGHVQGGFVTNINFLWDEHNVISLLDSTDLDAAADELTSSIPGLEILTTQVTTTSSGIPLGIVTSRWPATTADGVETVIFQKQVFFAGSSGTVVITLSTTEGFTDTVLPAFDAMIETVAIIN